MTKKQRRKIYEQVLWMMGNDFDYGGVCDLLWQLSGHFRPGYLNINWANITKETYPEFSAQRPRGIPAGINCLWWSHTPAGNAQRRIALEKAIALTY